MNVKISESLNDLLNMLNPKQQDAVLEMFQFYYKEYQRLLKEYPLHPEKVAYNMQLFVQECMDQKVKEMESTSEETVSCRKGCSFCCFQFVDVTFEEAVLITKYCEENNIEIDFERLKKQSSVDHKSFNELPIKDKRCVFLGKDNSCSIYSVRPSTCRKLVVVSDPKLCDTETNKGAQIAKLVDVEAEVVSNSASNATKSGSLSQMMLFVNPDK